MISRYYRWCEWLNCIDHIVIGCLDSRAFTHHGCCKIIISAFPFARRRNISVNFRGRIEHEFPVCLCHWRVSGIVVQAVQNSRDNLWANISRQQLRFRDNGDDTLNRKDIEICVCGHTLASQCQQLI